MDADDDRQIGEVKYEPHVDVLEVCCAGEGVAGLRVQGDEHQQEGETHDASLVEGLHRQQQRPVSAHTNFLLVIPSKYTIPTLVLMDHTF